MKLRNHEIVGIRPLLEDDLPVYLEVVGSMISGGFPNPSDNYFKEAVNLLELLIHNQTSTYLGYAWNDSMEPLIYEGAILLLDKSLEIRNGNYVACVYDGDWIMKRFWQENGVITLHSENPSYSPITVREGIQFKVFGKITKVIQSL